MKNLAAIAMILMVYGSVHAEESDGRMLAGQNDFSKDYLEKVTDERAVEQLRREQDRKDHQKYLRSIDRSRD